MCVHMSVRCVAAIIMVMAALSPTYGLAQTSWQVQQISVPGFAQDPFTDGRTVVWSDDVGVHKWRNGVSSTLSASGIRPVVDGDSYAWIERDTSISDQWNTLLFDDGTGPRVVFSAQPSTTATPYIASLQERPSLVGSQLAFSFSSKTTPSSFHYRIALIDQGRLVEDIDPLLGSNAFANSYFPSTNGTQVVFSVEQFGATIYQWVDGTRTEVGRSSTTRGGQGGWSIATDDYVFYTSAERVGDLDPTSSTVNRYSFDTGLTDVVGQSRWVDARSTWASGDRVIFTGTAGDLVLWDSGSSNSLDQAGSSSAGVSSQNVSWFSFASGTSVDVLLYDGSATQLLGSYPIPFSQPTLSVTDQLVTWNVWDGNLYVARAVPEPSTCFSLAAGLAFSCWQLLCRRTNSD
jgi:hypothetical protein